VNLDNADTIKFISKYYQNPAHLPIHRNHALAVAEVPASGVPIREKLQVIRREDAKQSAMQ